MEWNLQDRQGKKTIFGWGRNKHGQIGLGRNVELSLIPTEISFFRGKDVQWIQVGDEYSFVGTSSGLYGFGRSDGGQFGVSEEMRTLKEDLYDPHLLTDQVFSQMSCGWGHVLAIDSSNEICFIFCIQFKREKQKRREYGVGEVICMVSVDKERNPNLSLLQC